MLRPILVFMALCALFHTVEGQTPLHSQFWVDKLTVNPALCGDDMGLSVNGVVRNQWTRITSPLNTTSFCADAYLPGPVGTGLGMGLNAQTNTEGEGRLRTQKLELGLAGWGAVGTFADFSVGIGAGIIGKRITYPEGLVFSDQLDPVIGAVYPTGYTFPSLETGFRPTVHAGGLARVYLGVDRRRKGPIPFSRFILAGLSISNISRTRLVFSDNSPNMLPARTTFHLALNLTNGTSSDHNQCVVQPYAIHSRDGVFRSTMVGSRFFWRQLQWFAAFRNGKVFEIASRDAIVGGVVLAHLIGDGGRDASSALNIAYSYDFTLNGIGFVSTMGTHEISVTYRWNGWHYNNQYMKMQGHRQGRKRCPGFF